MKIKNSNNYALLALLFLAAFLERTVFDLGPNVELVTTAMVLTVFYFGKKESFWLTFAVMVLSDIIIGNSIIFIFTWSGFLIPSLLLPKLFRNSKLKIRNLFWKTAGLTGTGLLTNLFFYFYTNFGVWLIGNMYTKNMAGLITCYVNGLPFLKPQIFSSLLFIPLGFMACELILRTLKKLHLNHFKTLATN
jgi:hypothetical protein